MTITTDQLYLIVVGSMVLFWIAFTMFVAHQPGPRQWWTYDQRSENERRKLDDAKKRLNK